MKKILVCLLLILVATGCATNKSLVQNEVYDDVFNVSTYTSLDYNNSENYLKNGIPFSVGCSTLYKQLEDGTPIIGRNLDVVKGDEAVYVFNTKIEGLYDTIGLSYMPTEQSQTPSEIKEKGLSNAVYKVIPFLAEDCMNSEGLYVEINLRYNEVWPDGTPKYSCTGTNPDASQSVYMSSLPIYIATNCKNVEEAKKYVESINVYLEDNAGSTFGFLIADALGNHTILEFYNNKPVWNDEETCHTNFYVNPEPFQAEEYQMGVGRYIYLKSVNEAIASQDDMFVVLDSIRCSTAHDVNNELYDIRTEAAAAKPNYTYSYLMNENNIEELYDLFTSLSDGKIPEDINIPSNEQSIYTVVADCSNKSMFVRFFEDNEKTLQLSFGEIETQEQTEAETNN